MQVYVWHMKTEHVVHMHQQQCAVFRAHGLPHGFKGLNCSFRLGFTIVQSSHLNAPER